MDPSETFQMIVGNTMDLSVDPGNTATREQLVESLCDFASWLQNGGFVPNTGSLISVLENESRRL